MSTTSTSYYLTDFAGSDDIEPTSIYCNEHQTSNPEHDYTVLTFHLGTTEVKIFAHDSETLRKLCRDLEVVVNNREVIEDKPTTAAPVSMPEPTEPLPS
jgi:hypothetical protein